MIMKKLFEVYFAMRSNKLLHFERYYIVTYDVLKKVYCIWSVDAFRFVRLFKVCVSKQVLDFTWQILMGRSELCVNT